MFIRLLALAFILVTFQASALEVNGELKNAVVEKFASDPVTGLVEGRIYYNTVTKTSRIYDGTVWRNYVDANSTQTITNKTINGNNNTLTVLAPTQLSGFVPIDNGGTGQSTKAAAFDALSPNGSQGDLTYRGVSSNVALPVGANTQVLTLSGGYPSWQDASGGGGGSGEKTYITNPSALTVITGWVASSANMTVERTTTASELPRENTTGTGIKIVSAAGAAADGDYVYFDFDLDDIDTNRKLNVKWAQSILATYSAGEFEVFIAAQSDRTLAISTPLVTAIPAANMDFNGNGFDTNATTAVSLVIMATGAVTVGDGIVISDVIVGPGQIIPASPSGYMGTYTPTLNSNTSVSSNTAMYWRDGNKIRVYIRVNYNGIGDASSFSFTLPSGLNMDFSGVAATNESNFGSGTWLDAGTAAKDIQLVRNGSSTNSFNAYISNGTGTLQSGSMASGDSISAWVEWPIAEWAGAPNYAGSNDVEYAFNGSTSTSSDTSNFSYGPSGSPFYSFTTFVAKRVRFLTPIQPTDSLLIEVRDASTGKWVQLSNSIITYGRQAVIKYGIWIDPIAASETDVDVNFEQYATAAATGSFADVGTAWSAMTTYDRWRVVKAKAGSAVGFGAATSTSMGLVKLIPRLWVGATNSTNNTIVATTPTNLPTPATLTFTPSVPGKYKIYSQVPVVTNGATQTFLQLAVTSGAGSTTIFNSVVNVGVNVETSSASPFLLVSLVAGTSYTFNLQGWVTSGTGQIRADRAAIAVVAELIEQTGN